MEHLKLNEFSKEVFKVNNLKGFDVSKENIGQTLMLVVSELAEALEADRKDKHANISALETIFCENITISEYGKNVNFKQSFEYHIKDTFEDEIADSFIRLFDLVGGFNIDIEFHIEQKLKYNALRNYKHDKLY